jgi:hypothetical protein
MGRYSTGQVVIWKKWITLHNVFLGNTPLSKFGEIIQSKGFCTDKLDRYVYKYYVIGRKVSGIGLDAPRI